MSARPWHVGYTDGPTGVFRAVARFSDEDKAREMGGYMAQETAGVEVRHVPDELRPQNEPHAETLQHQGLMPDEHLDVDHGTFVDDDGKPSAARRHLCASCGRDGTLVIGSSGALGVCLACGWEWHALPDRPAHR